MSNNSSNTGDKTLDNNPIENLGLSNSGWLGNMIELLLGFALVFFNSSLYSFHAASINNANPWNADILEDPVATAFLVAQYGILLGLCVLMVLHFTSICLAVQMRALSSCPALSLSHSPILRACLYYTLIVFLVGCWASHGRPLHLRWAAGAASLWTSPMEGSWALRMVWFHQPYRMH